MLHRIIKRGSRKLPRSDAAAAAAADLGPSVTVNHASRSPIPSPTSPSPPPLPSPGQPVESLPLFRDVSAGDRPALFLRKLRLVAAVLDFSDPTKQLREKEVKRLNLVDLADYLQSGTAGRLTDAAQEALVAAVAANVFRSLPPAAHENSAVVDPSAAPDPDEEESYLDPAWPHLQLVYDVLLRYIISSDTDTKVAKRYLDHNFVLRILDLFDSEDPRERESLKTILHRIYGKFMVHRPFIRKAINNVFYRFIFETERHNGIAELLEILGSIINGFALPMKEEHKLFLAHVLVPLHKPKPVAMYHQQLVYCTVQFVEKDPKLADIVINGLLKYWPLTNCQKEVLFLAELEEVLEATQPTEFQRCVVQLFKRIACCISSSHFQVAERSLFFWNSDHIVNLIAESRNVILPIIFEALERNMHSHWNQAVKGLTSNVRKMFLDMDTDLFEKCQRLYMEKQVNAKELLQQRELCWRHLEAIADANANGKENAMVE